MIYFFCIVITVLISAIVPHRRWQVGKKRYLHLENLNRDLLILLAVLGPLLLSALRYGIGTDYFFTYIPQFNVIANGGQSYYEFGFYLLNRFVASFTKSGQWLIATVSSIFMITVYFQLFEMAYNYVISIILFYLSYNYFISLNNIRQSLAAAIILIAIHALINKNEKMFIFWMIIAVSIHRVSMAFFLILIVLIINFDAWIYMLGSVTVILIGRKVFVGAISLIASFIPRLQLYFYAEELQIYNEGTIGGLYVLVNLIFMAVLVFIELQMKCSKTEWTREWNFIKLNQCLLLCICGLDSILPAAYRIARVFSFSQFIFLPNAVFKYGKGKKNKLILIGIIIIGMGVLFAQNYISGAEEVFPYKSIIFNT